jgi:hypothetical protein
LYLKISKGWCCGSSGRHLSLVQGKCKDISSNSSTDKKRDEREREREREREIPKTKRATIWLK